MRHALDFLIGLVLWGTLAMAGVGATLGVLAQFRTGGRRARAPRAVASGVQSRARSCVAVPARACQVNVADHRCAPA